MTRSLLLIACFVASGQTAAAQDKAPTVPADVNFSDHVAPIVFNNCASCHRPGETGPFSLLTYKDVRKRGKLIQEVTASRYMPPWHPAPGFGEFQHERRLSDAQIAVIKRWVDTGMAEGVETKLPKLPEFPQGWQLGTPDLIVSMDRAFEVPATGRDIYRNFVLPLNLKEDKWVTAIELRPSARSVVHHVLFFVDTTSGSRAKEPATGQPGFAGMGFGVGKDLNSITSGGLGGWAAGGIAYHLPQGLARALPKGADLVLQTHFHPSGKAENEKTTVGLYFAKEKPKRTIVNFQAPPLFGVTVGIDIPAGDKAYKVHGKFKVPVDMDLISAGGHAHYICESMKVKATLPDGNVKQLLYIPKWDFNWQSEYLYKEPVRLPKGTLIEADLIYNNSAANPANPFSPPKRIKWGTASTDEMGSILFNAVPVRESDVAALRQGIQLELLNVDNLNNLLKKLKKK
ncbi:MAG TPA: cytochrome c [Gemmataceae bacterium]|nr:cytochrome c [Gemmataceae bacterium]